MITHLFKGAALTLQISLISGLIGLCIGTCIGIIQCQKLRIPILYRALSFYVALIRGTPLFIQILIIYFALPEVTGVDLNPLSSGILALSINSSAYLSETIRGGINSIDKGQWEASFCLGYTSFQTLQFIILPQAFRQILPAFSNEFISLIKDSSLLMILGIHELTKVSRDMVARELKPIEIYLMTAALYFVMTSVLSLISKHLEKPHHAYH